MQPTIDPGPSRYACVLILVSTVAAAQPRPAGETPVPQTVEVTGSAAEASRRDDTASRIVITEAELTKFGDAQLLEVFKRLPGITVTGNEIRMRGLGSGYTQILLNGERTPPGFTLESISPGLVERIEILRAATAEFSTQSVAGTINVVLKKRVSTAQRDMKAGLATGKGYRAPVADFTLSDKDGPLSWSASGSLFHNRFDSSPRGEDRGTDAAGQPNLQRTMTARRSGTAAGGSLSPRLNLALPGGDSLSWTGLITAHRQRFDGERRHVEIFGAPIQYPFSTTHNAIDQHFGRSELQWTHAFTPHGKLDTRVGLTWSARDVTFLQQGYDAGATQTLDAVVVSSADDRGLTFAGKFGTTLGERHAWTVGWDTGVSTRKEVRDQRDRPLPGVVPVVRYEDFHARITRVALFGQDEWTVTPTWSVYAGLRWEAIHTASDGNRFDAVGNRAQVVSPIVQTLWKFPDSSGRQLRFAITRTFKAPPTASLIPRLFTSTNNSPTEPDTRGNPALKPELATGFDLAYEHFLGAGALISVSGSVRNIGNNTRRLLTLENGRWVVQPVNDGRATSRGLELEAKFPLARLWPAAPPVDLRASLAHCTSRVASVPGPNNRLDQQAPLSATFGLDYRMKSGEVVAGGSFAFKQGGELRLSENQYRAVSARRELDLYLLWRITPGQRLRFTLANVLRQDFVNRNRYDDAAGSLTQTEVYPSGIHLRANLELKF